jgi:hypothetical protein
MTQELLTRPIIDASLATVQQIAAANGEPQWLLERRTEAWRRFERMDLPDSTD